MTVGVVVALVQVVLELAASAEMGTPRTELVPSIDAPGATGLSTEDALEAIAAAGT